MELREYQESVIERARQSLRRGVRRLIIQAATGSGKTIIAAAIIKSAIEKGKKVLFLVHFRQLAYQAVERFAAFGMGSEVGLIMAGEESHLYRPVQVAMVQTYARRLQLDDGMDRWFHKADLVCYDECHSSIAKTRRSILEMYQDDTVILGLTATPCRADGRGLGEVYQDIIECVSIERLTNEGFLVPAVYYGCKELPDLKNIPMVAGDYNKKELGERVDQPKLVGDIFENWARIAPERQTIIFATNVKHSKHIRDQFSKKGVTIEHLDAHSPEDERQDVLRRFKAGDVQVVTNVGIFSEGFDAPWVSCVVLARPSKSYARFVQMAGRGLRPYEGTENCIIIDHAGLVQEHGFLDDPVCWNLSGKEKAWKKRERRQKEKHPLTCEICGFIFAGKRICPQCGLSVKDYGKKIAALDAELERLGKTKKAQPTAADKQRFWQMAEYYRRVKGYKKGWEAWTYKHKFGVWPRGFSGYEPISPDFAFYNYIKYMNIKKAKARVANECKSSIAS